MGKEYLGELEQLVLLALLRLRDNAYGVTIREELTTRAGRDVSIGALYTTLERMEKKGLVSSRMGESTPERGGRAKKFYKVSAQGVQALNRSKEMYDQMWTGVRLAGA
jgi:DNA-binding PadR family transcriptional regulator